MSLPSIPQRRPRKPSGGKSAPGPAVPAAGACQPLAGAICESLEGRRLLAASLLADLNLNTAGSNPGPTVEMGGVRYFSASDYVHGYELWRSDGTDAGTWMVKDIRPGPAGSGWVDGVGPTHLTVIDGRLFFVAAEPTGGTEVWTSDGTGAGTYRIQDLSPGINAGFMNGGVAVNGRFVYFGASAAGSGLFATDGTPSGTVPLKLNFYTNGLVAHRGFVYFIGNDTTSGYQLWKTDGTPGGTTMVKELDPTYATTTYATPVGAGEMVYFSGYTPETGFELWKSDGTEAGTTIVADLAPGTASSSPSRITYVNGKVFFATSSATGDQTLHVTDGTATGTTLLLSQRNHPPQNLTAVGDTLFFAYRSPDTGVELWKSDGTPQGTGLVKDINPSTAFSYPSYLTAYGGAAYFVADDGVHGYELWRSDGSAGGTVMIGEIYPGPRGIVTASPSNNGQPNSVPLSVIDGLLYFAADDGLSGIEPWVTDGTTAGTRRLHDVNRLAHGSNPTSTATDGDLIYFAADNGQRGPDGFYGTELFVSDGTPQGTRLVLDVYPGLDSLGAPASSKPSFFVFDPDRRVVYFGAQTPTGQALFRSDGTAAGTVRVHTNGIPLTMFRGRLVFTWGPRLWQTDGTPEGTTLLKDFGGIVSRTYRAIGDTLYFVASDGLIGDELWKTDGTPEGTVLVKDVRPGFTGSSPSGLTELGGRLYFTASDGARGRELWTSDGTDAGTFLITDARPNDTGDFTSSQMAVVGDALLYAYVGSQGVELWRTDGSADGTRMLKRLTSSAARLPHSFTVVDGRLFFAANDGVRGYELWTSDGTEAGTVMVKDITPGNSTSTSAGPLDFVALDGRLYFTADDGVHGRELWTSDGTAAGTLLTADIDPGSGWAFLGVVPPGFVAHEGRLVFAATHSDHGTELWQYTPERVFLNPDGLLAMDPASSPSPRVQLRQDAQGTTAEIDGASWTFESDAIGSLVLRRGAAAALASASPFHVRGLSIGPDATLDVGDGTLVVGTTPQTRDVVLANLEALVGAARNATPRWTGPGLTSSAAAVDPLTTLAVALLGDDVIVKHTYNGDANLDGRVNADDYFRIDQGFLAQPSEPLFAQGDLNYDGKINADDYFLIDQAFLGQGAPLAGDVPVVNTTMASVAALPVPKEPEEKVVRKRAVRPIFSDEPVVATRTARRTSAARRR